MEVADGTFSEDVPDQYTEIEREGNDTARQRAQEEALDTGDEEGMRLRPGVRKEDIDARPPADLTATVPPSFGNGNKSGLPVASARVQLLERPQADEAQDVEDVPPPRTTAAMAGSLATRTEATDEEDDTQEPGELEEPTDEAQSIPDKAARAVLARINEELRAAEQPAEEAKPDAVSEPVEEAPAAPKPEKATDRPDEAKAAEAAEESDQEEPADQADEPEETNESDAEPEESKTERPESKEGETEHPEKPEETKETDETVEDDAESETDDDETDEAEEHQHPEEPEEDRRNSSETDAETKPAKEPTEQDLLEAVLKEMDDLINEVDGYRPNTGHELDDDEILAKLDAELGEELVKDFVEPRVIEITSEEAANLWDNLKGFAADVITSATSKLEGRAAKRMTVMRDEALRVDLVKVDNALAPVKSAYYIVYGETGSRTIFGKVPLVQLRQDLRPEVMTARAIRRQYAREIETNVVRGLPSTMVDLRLLRLVLRNFLGAVADTRRKPILGA
jgi:chemotaxis protein histidine kinase CheA